MSSRTVSLVLVAAVIACPIWCGDAGGCRSRESSRKSTLCSGETPRTCCGSQQGPHDQHEEQDCPCEATGCQGICGGAVPEQPVRLNNVGDNQYAGFAEAHVADSALPHIQGLRLSEPGPDGPSNYGRRVRTRLMSILC